MKRACAIIAEGQLWVLLLLAPFLLFPSPTRSVAMIGVPLLWVCRWVARGHPVERTPLDWPILLLLVQVLVSLYATFDVAFSLPKIAGVVLGVAVYYAMAEHVTSDRRLKWAVSLFVVGGGVGLAAFGLLNTRWLYKFPGLVEVTSRLPVLVKGLPGAEQGISANQLAGTLLWLFFPIATLAAWAWSAGQSEEGASRWAKVSDLAMGESLRPSPPSLGQRPSAMALRWQRAVLIFAGAMVGGVLLLTQSRSALIGLAVGAVVVVWLVAGRYRPLLAALIVVCVVAVALVGPRQLADRFFGGEAFAQATSLGTFDFRVKVWSRALYGIADFPFTGMGMNMFRRVVHVLYPLFSIPPSYDVAHAHNEFLQAALDLGIPGLVAFIALHLLALWMLFQVGRLAVDPFHQALALGLVGGLLAHVVYGMTDAVALGAKPGFVWWALLAFSVALHRLQVANGQ